MLCPMTSLTKLVKSPSQKIWAKDKKRFGDEEGDEQIDKNVNMKEDSGNHPCGVCRKGVGDNSIRCVECLRWVHKKM